LKIIKILKAYPIASRVRGEGLIDLSKLSLIIRGYDVEYSVEGNVKVEKAGDNIFKVSGGPGKAVFRIRAYGNFDEYLESKSVEVLG
jgi:hypothetical protein